MPKIAPDTKVNILIGALQLFMQKGYKDVSYQDLVKKTGLSKGAIYHYFASKEELLVAVFEFLVEASKQTDKVEPQNLVTDKESFIKLFIDIKVEQIISFKEMMGETSFKLNKLLFFFEAINENEKLKQIIADISAQEKAFLEKGFVGIKNNHNLPEGKDPALLAECLYWMLQGSEMMLFFVDGDNWEDVIVDLYVKTINDFFKVI